MPDCKSHTYGDCNSYGDSHSNCHRYGDCNAYSYTNGNNELHAQAYSPEAYTDSPGLARHPPRP